MVIETLDQLRAYFYPFDVISIGWILGHNEITYTVDTKNKLDEEDFDELIHMLHIGFLGIDFTFQCNGEEYDPEDGLSVGEKQ